MRSREKGQFAACITLGLVKRADAAPALPTTADATPLPAEPSPPTHGAPPPPRYLGPNNEALHFIPSVGAHVSHQLVGSPKRLWRELRTGDWRAPGSYVREMLWPVPPPAPGAGPLAKFFGRLAPAVNYIPAAMAVYEAAQAPDNRRAESVGSAAGALLGTLLGSPGGLIGTTLGTVAGDVVGRRLGRDAGNALSELFPEEVA